MSSTMTVTKLNWRGEKVYSWQGNVFLREPDHVVLRAVWHGPGTVHVADDVSFERGDVFYEHYYDARPFGLWQVLTPDELALKCWYCNVSTPAVVGDDSVSFRDLLLDVLLLPNGVARVLDRDDLERACAEGLDPALKSLAEDAARDIMDLIAGNHPPFNGEWRMKVGG